MGWFEKMYRDVIEEIKELAKKAMARNTVAESEIHETLFEDVEVTSDRDYKELVYKDIPDLLVDILKHAGLKDCNVYRKTADITGAEYIAVCQYPKPITLELDVDFDCFGDVCNIDLLFVRAIPAEELPIGLRPFYREVYTEF